MSSTTLTKNDGFVNMVDYELIIKARGVINLIMVVWTLMHCHCSDALLVTGLNELCLANPLASSEFG